MKLKERIKIEFLIFIGRFYFVFILSFIIAVLTFIISLMVKEHRISTGTVKTAIFLGLAVLGILKGFFKAAFLRFPKPEGISAHRAEYAKLYHIIDEIKIKTDCPKIDFILLTPEFNASIVERPSLGIFGFFKRYLIIGVPLMLSLSEEELKAVIAHECGHLSKAHGKWGVRLYRVTSLWESIAREFEKEKSSGSILVNWFITRYVPALNSLNFSMRKSHEYEADGVSLNVVDKQTFANALAKTNLYGYFMDIEFWPEIGKLNNSEREPVKNIYYRMEEEVQKDFSKELIDTNLNGLLSHRSLPYSTHPSYIERIEALDADRPNINKNGGNALRAIFKDKADKVLDDMSKYWYSCVKEGWTNYYNEINELREKLTELNNLYSDKQLTVEQAIERAHIVERLEGPEKALEVFKVLKDEYKDEVVFEYNVGRLMAYAGKEEGIKILEQVMEEDPQMIPDCCYDLVNYFGLKNEKDKAAEYYSYAVEFMKTHEEVKVEREEMRLDDFYIPHDLSSDTINMIRQELLKYGIIKKAYIAVKYAEMSGQFPIYVIGIEYKASPKKERESIQQELADKQLLLWDYWIVELSGRNKQIQYNMDKIDEARII